MVKVVPGFQTLFDNFDQQLPWATRQVILLSDFVSANLLYLGSVFILLPVCYVLLTKSPATKRYIDLFMWRIPIITKLYQMSFVTSFSLTAYAMLNAGLPLNQALSKIQNGTKNSHTKTKLKSVIENVQEGESFYQSLKQTALFPFMFLTLIKVGEETGRLDATLKTLANIYQTRLEAHIKQIISLIEPAIVVLLGGIIGGLVLVMYLPIFEMSTFL
jgi:type IV pilus assembly protein PilC